MTDWQHEFPQDKDLCYLNHAAVAPWPKRSHDAVVRFAAENLSHGARHYPRWLATEARLREQLQRLVNAPSSDDISLLKNTSEGLSVIAAGLDWQSGDRVLISNQEFPSNRIPWQALERHGVSVDQADLGGDDPEGALIAAMTPETRLLSISSVQYGTGLRMDLARLGEACRERGILFCVDAIQSLGVLPMDVQAINADFVVADGHKWMLGPEGLALFYCRAALRPTLTLHQHGWHMVADAGDYSRQDWQPAHDGTRFECGSPNLLCAHALSASLSLIEEVGVARLAAQVAGQIDYLANELDALGLPLVTPTQRERRAGILTFLPRGDSKACWQALMADGVVCAPRGGGIRLSPHFYTPQRVLEQAMAAISRHCR